MREKLIELLGEDVCKSDCCGDCECQGNEDMCIAALKAYMADHLISNGVTFQVPIVPGHDNQYNIAEMAYNNGYAKGVDDGKPKWIPVSERLPEEDGFVLVYTIDKTVGEAIMLNRKKFYWAGSDEDAEPIAVTHWMPLPEPPKEEE